MDKTKMVSWCVVVLTAAMISVFVLSAPANAGVSPEDGAQLGDGGWAIIGETNLTFLNETGDIIPYGTIKSTWEGSNIIIPFTGSFDSTRHEDTLVEGNYRITGPNGNITIDFFSPELDVKTKVCGEEFSWVTKGDNITFEANTNLWIIIGPLPNNITYKLVGPDGVQLHSVGNVSLSNISVDYYGINSTKINTTNLDTGMYTLSIETDPGTNNGLDTEGPEVSFEVRSKGVAIEVEPKEQATYEEMVFTVSTTPHTDVSLKVTWGVDINVEFIEGKGDVERGGPTAFGTSDNKGEFKAVAYFAVSGTYEITATEYGCSGEAKLSNRENTTDSIEVKIVPFKAELKVNKDPPIYHIGENVKITGSANTGNTITLKIDDDVVATNLDVKGFDYTWPTKDKSPDSYRIAIWILPISDPTDDPPDASISVVLIRGGLFAEPSAPFVALGDEFTIEGTVPGRDRVDILTIAPKGGGGKGFLVEVGGVLDAPGLTYGAYGVDTDGTFETEKIKVSKKVDTGMYLIAALNYGRDGVWGKSGSDDLLRVISGNNYAMDLGVKTTDQILAILKDRTINAAGSDDLLGIATISVENGFVTLDDIDAVALNEEIKVTGTTNRQVGTSIIVTVEGLDEKTPKLKPKIKEVVEDPDNFYNKFEISFATASASIGAYEVTADDGDGHIDTTTVNILLAVEPSVNVSATSTPIVEPEGKSESEGAAAATPLQTPTPTAIEETETEKQPGFEAVFSIAVLLVVTWLMLRTRQRQRKDKKR